MFQYLTTETQYQTLCVILSVREVEGREGGGGGGWTSSRALRYLMM